MHSLHSFLISLGFRATSTANEYLAKECWHCGGIDKLYFNVKKLIGVCLKCSQVIDLKALARESGSGNDLKSILETLEGLQRESEVAELGFRDAVFARLNGLSVEDSKQKGVSEVAFPDEFRTLEDGHESVSGRKALAYLEGRGFRRKNLFGHGFGFCATGYYGGRIIVPFRENGVLVYWQARDFTGKQPPSSKILNPPNWQVPNGKSDVLFNYDTVKELDLVIVCESWGSALATGHYATALNGKSMSEVQLQKLKACKCRGFMVLLDHGAEDKAWEIAKTLASTRYTSVATLPYGDPNEVPRPILLDAIKSSVQYSKLAHIMATTKALG
jgi:hypothetical protein